MDTQVSQEGLDCATNQSTKEHYHKRLPEQKLVDMTSSTALGMKLFGIKREQQMPRHSVSQDLTVHPESNFRLIWDAVMVMVLLANLFTVPVEIAYFYYQQLREHLIFNIICDSFFICDIMLTFLTATPNPENKRELIRNRRAIAIHYLKSWFAFDVISTLPIYYFGNSDQINSDFKLLRLAKLFQLFKLLRLSRLIKRANFFLSKFHATDTIVSICTVLFSLVFVSHWCACLMYLVAVVQGLPSDCWIVIEHIQDMPWFHQYIRTMLKSVSISVGLGYGVLPPLNTIDTWTCIAACIAGFANYTLMMSLTVSVIQSIDKSGKNFRAHMQQVGEYMKYRKLPPKLKHRILDYYSHRYNGKLLSEGTILNELSDCLRQEVIYHICGDILKTVPLFVDAEPCFVEDFINRLQFEIYQPGDIVFEVLSKGEKMFLIQEGIVEIISADGKVITKLSEGSYFGEISLLAHKSRTATVRAVSYCRFFTLSKDDFYFLIENYPVMRETLETVAAERLQCLGEDLKAYGLSKRLLSNSRSDSHLLSLSTSAEALHTFTAGSRPKRPAKMNSVQTMLLSFITKNKEEISASEHVDGVEDTDAAGRTKIKDEL